MSKVKIKTSPQMLSRINHALGRGNVVKHPPTENNPLGQSGNHTFTDDVMNVLRAAGDNEGRQYRALKGFFDSLYEFKEEGKTEFCIECLNVLDDCACNAHAEMQELLEDTPVLTEEEPEERMMDQPGMVSFYGATPTGRFLPKHLRRD